MTRVQFAAAEIFPMAKTGGLADVCASLPAALTKAGVDVRLVMPGYEQALDLVDKKMERGVLRNALGFDRVRIIDAVTPDTGLPITLIDVPELFGGGGGLYQNADGTDRRDNHRRFALFCHAVARLGVGEGGSDWVPDIIHCHDWHTGLVPLLLRVYGRRHPKTLFTIHNMAFQGLFSFKEFDHLGLQPTDEVLGALEFFGKVNFLKGGLMFADWITTVSPTYAREIQTKEFGCGLEGLVRDRADRLSGILNGIDANFWTPWKNKRLACSYSADDPSGKQQCKLALQRELGLIEDVQSPLIIFASRLTSQKMADTLHEALPQVLAADPKRQFALLGQGDPEIEAAFRMLSQNFPGRVSVRIGYSEDSAHRLHAGGDLLMHGSRFEPCGLTQLYAMRFGTLPVVRPVGGLADTIVHASEQAISDRTANGFCFEEATADAMIEAVDHALGLYFRPDIWSGLQMTAMSIDFSWERSARKYIEVYDRLVPHRKLAREASRESPAEPARTPSEIGNRREERRE